MQPPCKSRPPSLVPGKGLTAKFQVSETCLSTSQHPELLSWLGPSPSLHPLCLPGHSCHSSTSGFSLTISFSFTVPMTSEPTHKKLQLVAESVCVPWVPCCGGLASQHLCTGMLQGCWRSTKPFHEALLTQIGGAFSLHTCLLRGCVPGPLGSRSTLESKNKQP